MSPREVAVGVLRCDAVELTQRAMMLNADAPLLGLAGRSLAAGLLARYAPSGKAATAALEEALDYFCKLDLGPWQTQRGHRKAELALALGTGLVQLAAEGAA